MKPLPCSAILLLTLNPLLRAQDPVPAPAAETAPAPTLEDRIGDLERKILELQSGKQAPGSPAPMTSIIQELEDEELPAEEGEELKLPRDLEQNLVAHARASFDEFLIAFAEAPDAEKWSYAVCVESAGTDDRVWMALESVDTDGVLRGRKRDGFLGAESEEEAKKTMTEPMAVPSYAVTDWSYISNGKKVGDYETFARLHFMMLNFKMRKLMSERYPDNFSIMESVGLDQEEALLTGVLEDYTGL